MIQIAVDTRAATVVKTELITSGSAGIEVEFAFSSDWDGLSKIAVFDGCTEVDKVLDGTTATIPPECIAEAGNFLMVGAYGTDGTGNIVIPTVRANVGVIKRGAVPGGAEPIEPTPSVVDQILTAAENAEDDAKAALEAAERVEQYMNSVAFEMDAQGILTIGGNT